MGSRALLKVLDKYMNQRLVFAQNLAELTQRSQYAQQIIEQGGIAILRNLLTDTSGAIQYNACNAIGRLSSHDPNIALMMIQQDIVRILLYFNMDKSNVYLKRAALIAIRNIVRHSSELCEGIMDTGGLDQIVSSLSDYDPGVKEATAWVCGSFSKHNSACASAIIGTGAVPLLIICLQEPEINVRLAAAYALGEIAKHDLEAAQTVVENGAVIHLVRVITSVATKLKRQAMIALGNIAKQSMSMAESIIECEADVVQNILESCGHTDELVRKSACGLIKEIVQHSPDLAQVIVTSGGLGVIVNSVIRNRGETKVPGILTLGFIAGHTSTLAMAVIYSKGVDALGAALNDGDSNVGASAAWALGQIAQHSSEHAKVVSTCGLLPRILEIYLSPGSDEMKQKAKQALKMILLRTDDLENVEPLLSTAPPNILKYVVAQYSKVLPINPAARREFVFSGALKKLQQLLEPEVTGTGTEVSMILKEHIAIINQCFPEDVLKFFKPDYPKSLLDRVDEYHPMLNIDPALWSEKLFSDNQIPKALQDEILALQAIMQPKKQSVAAVPIDPILEMEIPGEAEEKIPSKNSSSTKQSSKASSQSKTNAKGRRQTRSKSKAKVKK